MPVLVPRNSLVSRVVVDRAGLYPLTPDLCAAQPANHWPHGVRVTLLVCHLGDFVTTRALGCEPQTRCTVRLNGRPLLGNLERLSDDVLIDVNDDGTAYCVEYVHAEGPAIAIAMPDSSSLRCAYSHRSLSGLTATRCGGCYRLFSVETWEGLERKCPSCQWIDKKAYCGEHCESSGSRLR